MFCLFLDMQLWSREGQRYFTLFSSWLRAGPIKPDIITVIPSLLILMQLPIYGIIMSNFFRTWNLLLTKEIAHWKKICCAMGGKERGKKERNRCAAVVISKAGKLLAGVYREICQWEEGSKWAKAQCRSDEGRGEIIEQGLLYILLDSIDKLSRNFRQLY